MAFEEVNCVNPERLGYPIQNEHRRIPFTALNSTEVGLMNARPISQLFLA
jgi:hypothetical protein